MSEQVLLAQALVLKDKHDALAAATGQNFNLFEIIGRETDEVHTHSAILGELLDPKGSHGQGTVFAKHFLERLDIPNIDVSTVSVGREVMIASDSRADILIETDDACVVIENKIGAADQPRQLERYYAYAAKWQTAKVVYLTLHSDKPSEESLGELSLDNDVKCISYEEHVIKWLDDCIKEVARVPQIREILAHYQALLRKLTGTSTEELNMELVELLKENQGEGYNFELAPAIMRAMTDLSVETEWAFWKMLRKRLEAADSGGWRLVTVKEIGNPPKEVTEEVVRHAHGTGRSRWYYGSTFRIASNANQDRYTKDGVDVLLRVECDGWGWGFYGLIAAKQTSSGTRQLQRSGEEARHLFERWAERMSGFKQDRWRTDNDWWLAWKYPNDNVDLCKNLGRNPQPWLDPKEMRKFREKKCVERLVADISGVIDKIERLTD